MDVPNVKRREYTLVRHELIVIFEAVINCKFVQSYMEDDDEFLHLLLDGVPKDDVKITDDVLRAQIKELEATASAQDKDVIVTIISAMGEEQAISAK